MLEVGFEWEEAPGVSSKALARTWARLELAVDGKPVSRFWSEATQSVRTGVYASLLPLASWIARNWWVLLYQGTTPKDVSQGPRTIRNRGARSWFFRHNLLFAREGMAYPDLSIMRVDDRVGLIWNGDPADTTMPGRFLDSGSGLTSCGVAEAQLVRLVDAVRERVSGCEDEPGVRAFIMDWEAVRGSQRREPDLCARLGMLGLDPYDAELSGDLENVLAELSFASMVTRDLLATSQPVRLDANVQATRKMLEKLAPQSSERVRPSGPSVVAGPAYVVGFERARWLRSRLRLSPDVPVLDLDDVVSRTLGSGFSINYTSKADADVEGAVQSNGAVWAVVWSRNDSEARRFHTARVIHHAVFATTRDAPTRLLTRSHDWQQAASRSFAAEFLAPASALEARLGGRVDWDVDDAKLAKEFKVSSYLIRHQLENHRLE